MQAKTDSLVQRACDGDAQAFGELYELYARQLYRYAYSVLGSQQAALDAVQDAVCAAFSGISSLRNEEAFKAWLFKILSNVCSQHCTDLARQRGTVPLEDFAAQTLEAPPSDPGNLFELETALQTLEPLERQIVVLSAVEGYKSGEIAVLLGCPPGTVRSKLSRSLKKLRRYMEC